MSLEDLGNIRVTTIGKKQQSVARMPAAAYVITQEEIRRSGANNIPDLLRLVPGVQVAQIDHNNWAVSIRGANSISSNKLLVLIDGRAVYYPTYSNVFWDVQDTLFEDIERIEVIRGPGASLWGANAVNGVINIVTKSAKQTRGTLITAGGGNDDRAFGSARYGGELGESGHYRLFGKFFVHENLVHLPESPLDGQPHMLRGGFRTDWHPARGDQLTVQGGIYQGATPQAIYRSVLIRAPLLTRDDIAVGGVDLLLRWTRRLASGSETTLQVYYDRSRHPDVLLTQFHEVLDFDFQHHVDLESHDILWGGGFRNTRQASSGVWELSLNPSGRGLRLFSAFVQDEIRLISDRLVLTAGTKLEHNDYSGVEVQPTLRLLWTPTRHQAAWASASRAVRMPSVWDNAVVANMDSAPLPDGTPTLATLASNSDFRSEQLLAYELGYRAQPAKHVSIDVTAFFQHYNYLCSLLQGQPFFVPSPTPHVVIPLQISNLQNGNAYGVEIGGAYNPLKRWKLTGSYSFLRQITGNAAPERIFSFPGQDGDNPRHQFQVHSYLTLSRSLEFDTHAYYVGALPGQSLDHYTRLDTRLGWQPTHNLELSFGAQNLLQDKHYEFRPYWEYIVSGRVERSYFGKVMWRF